MTVAALDLIADNQAARTASDNRETAFLNATQKSDLFASLLQGQLPQNVSFARIDRQLDVPRASKLDESGFDHRPFGDDASRADTIDDFNETAQDDPTAALEPRRNAPEQAAGLDDAPPPEDSEAAQAPAGRPAQTDTAAQQGQTAAADQPSSVGRPADALAAQQAKAVANQAGQVQRGAAAPNEAAPDALPAQSAAASIKAAQNAATLKASLTKSEQTVAQPASTLTAAAAVTAQNVQTGKGTEGRLTAAQAAQFGDAASDGDIAIPAAGKAAAKTAAKSGAGANAGQGLGAGAANAQQNANGQAVMIGPSPQAQQFAAMMASAQAGQGAVSAAAPAAPGAGLAGAPLTVDPMTGGAPIQNGYGATPVRPTGAAAAAQRPSVPQAMVTEQVAVNIHKAANQGLDRITIQMRPAELGKIDIRMEVAQDGRMTAVVNVERQETYDMLRSDARNLAQTLQNAGLNTDAGSLSFNLSSRGQQGFGDASPNAKGPTGANGDADAAGEGDLIAGAEDGLLGFGEIAEADENGRYDVRV